jgi:hypothetical protein
MSDVRSFACGLMLVSWLMPATSLAAPAAPEDPSSTVAVVPNHLSMPGLALWTEPTVPDGPRILKWVEEQARLVLSERAQPLAPENAIYVVVRGEPYDYRVHITLMRYKRPLEQQPDVLICECGSDEMIDRIGAAIDAGADRLEQAADRPLNQVQAPEHPPTSRDRRRLSALGYAGIGVGVLGAGLLSAGIPLALRPDQVRGAGSDVETLTTRRSGIGLAVAGGVAIATGVSLLIADLVRRRERAVTVTSILGPRQAGLFLSRRF